jgi:hypothetical protein
VQKARIRAQKIAGRFNARAADIKISYFHPIVSEPERNEREEMYGFRKMSADLERKSAIQDDISAVWELDTASLKVLKDSASARPMQEPLPVMSMLLPVICMWD